MIRAVQSSQCPPDARQSSDADIGRPLASTAATQSTSMPPPSSTRSDGGAPASRSDMLADPSDPSTQTNRCRSLTPSAAASLARFASNSLITPSTATEAAMAPPLDVVKVIADCAGSGAKLTRLTPSVASVSAAWRQGSARFPPVLSQRVSIVGILVAVVFRDRRAPPSGGLQLEQ